MCQLDRWIRNETEANFFVVHQLEASEFGNAGERPKKVKNMRMRTLQLTCNYQVPLQLPVGPYSKPQW